MVVVGKIFLSDSDGDDAGGNLSPRRRRMRLPARPPIPPSSPASLSPSVGRSVGRTFGRKFIPDSRYQLLIRATVRRGCNCLRPISCKSLARSERGERDWFTELQPYFCLSLPHDVPHSVTTSGIIRTQMTLLCSVDKVDVSLEMEKWA